MLVTPVHGARREEDQNQEGELSPPPTAMCPFARTTRVHLRVHFGRGGPHQKRAKERAKEGKRKRQELKDKEWVEAAKWKGKLRNTVVWTWNVQRARISFPRMIRFAEILKAISKSSAEVVLLTELREPDRGITWIKEKDLHGALIHSGRSAVFLRDEWAVDWKDQGGKRWYGGRSTAVELNGIRWVATYQPLWQSNRSEFESYREILSNLVTRCDRKTKLVIGGDFNASVGTPEMRECDSATGPFGHGKTNAAGRDLAVVPHTIWHG